MNNSKHTPGPWNVAENDSCCIMAKGKHIATAFDTDGGRSESRRGMRNARLIAAAPELLEACREGLRLLEINLEYNRGKVSDLLKAAIRKAEGGE